MYLSTLYSLTKIWHSPFAFNIVFCVSCSKQEERHFPMILPDQHNTLTKHPDRSFPNTKHDLHQ